MKFQVHLGAHRIQRAVRAGPRLRGQHAGEQRGAHRTQEEARRADIGEAQRRQVQLQPATLAKLRAGDLVDLEAREAVVFAVALHLAVIDVVVAEAAEVEVGQRVVAVAAADAGGVVEPDRGMLPAAGAKPKSKLP